MMRLNRAPLGSEQKIVCICASDQMAEAARELGVKEGEYLTVVGSFFGSMIVRLDDCTRVALDYEMTEKIVVN